MTRRNTKAPPSVVPRAKVWLEVDGAYVFGSGIARILQAVQETGSIKHAAEKIGRSYRFIWSRIKAAEESFGAKLVETQVGGQGTKRSELTPLANDLLADFAQLRSDAVELVERAFQERVAATLKRHQAQ